MDFQQLHFPDISPPSELSPEPPVPSPYEYPPAVQSSVPEDDTESTLSAHSDVSEMLDDVFEDMDAQDNKNEDVSILEEITSTVGDHVREISSTITNLMPSLFSKSSSESASKSKSDKSSPNKSPRSQGTNCKSK